MSALLEALRQVARNKAQNEQAENSEGGASLQVRIPPVKPVDLSESESEREEPEQIASIPAAPQFVSETKEKAPSSQSDLTEMEAETLSLLLSGEAQMGESANEKDSEKHSALSDPTPSSSSADDLEALLQLAQSEKDGETGRDAGIRASTTPLSEPVHEEPWEQPDAFLSAGKDASHDQAASGPAGGLSEKEQAELLAQREAAFSDYAAQMNTSDQPVSTQGFEEWDIPEALSSASVNDGDTLREEETSLLDSNEESVEKQNDALPLISEEETARALLNADAVTAPADSKAEAADRGKERWMSLLIWLALPVLFAGALGYGGWQWYQHLEEDFEQQYRRMDYQRLEQQYRRTVQAQQTASFSDSEKPAKTEKHAETSSVQEASQQKGAGASDLVATDLNGKDKPLSVLIQPEVRIIRQVIPSTENKGESRTQSTLPAPPPELVESQIEPVEEVAIRMDPLSEVETLLQQGDAERAIRRLSTFLSRHPQETQGYVLMGLAYQQLKQPARALYYLQKALQLDPYAQAAAEAMALTVVSLPDTRTETVLAELFDRFPQSEVIALYYANHMAQSGRVKEAEEILQQSIRLAPAANLYYNLAVLQVAAGEYEAAREAVRQALRYMNRTPHSFQESDLLRLMQQIQPHLVQKQKGASS